MEKIAESSTDDPLAASTSIGAAEHVSWGNPASRSEDTGLRMTPGNALQADDIINRQGEKLGKLLEVMFNVQNGRIAYAVVAGSDFPGNRLLVVPWHVLTLDPVSRCLILDLDREEIERAPSFDRDHWSTMADEAWADEVHTYFGTRP